jgi:hypothetical protein
MLAVSETESWQKEISFHLSHHMFFKKANLSEKELFCKHTFVALL